MFQARKQSARGTGARDRSVHSIVTSLLRSRGAGIVPSPGLPAVAGRFPAALALLASLGVLIVASLLEADARGLGTHQQLGLPPCGFRLATGLPCATCGYTTSFTHAAKGRMGRALATQPAGAILAVATAAAALLSACGLITGASLAPVASALWHPRTIVIGGGIVVGSWVYKLVATIGVFR